MSDTSSPNQQRWLRLTELYWGAPKARLSKLTLKIITLNAATLLILLGGFIAFLPYQESITASRLEAFSKLAITSSKAIENAPNISIEQSTLVELAEITRARIRIFDKNGAQLFQTEEPFSSNNLPSAVNFVKKLLKGVTPSPKSTIKSWPKGENPNLQSALNGEISLSVWRAPKETNQRILLSVAVPLAGGGAALFVRGGADIEQAINQFWARLLQTFLAALIITLIISIYISGTIARPLHRLARAAKKVAAGRARADSIPDLSKRGDEIGDLSLALRAMTKALAQRIDENAAFAADVTHELKNPLASARSALETMQTIKNAADKKTLMQVLQNDIERMNTRITDISMACRLEADLSRKEFKPVDIARILPQANKKELGEFIVMGQENALSQVFENLVSNARSFGDKIEISLEKNAHNIVVEIKDNGCGIPNGLEEKIFERFYTSRAGTDSHCGLGLSIARQIIAAHGGNITARNHKNGGAIFTITLPLSKITLNNSKVDNGQAL